ncbi:MAG: hypothetical protein ACKVOO_12745 [Burkholderiaceae bacterium]
MSRANTLLLYLYSTRNIAGCVLALLGLAAFFLGVIQAWWLPICMGLYGVGALGVPSSHVIDVEIYRRYDGQRLVEGVQELIRQTRKQLPADALAVLESIPQVLEPLLPRLTGQGNAAPLPPAQVQSIVGAITRDLPETVAGYLRLPPVFANMHKLEGGKTAHELLVEQLGFLKQQLGSIAEAAFRDDADAVLTNGQYLKEKFHAPTYLV